MTVKPVPVRQRTRWRQARSLARRAFWMEVHGYQSIYRFVFARPRVPAGAAGYSYHGPVLAIFIVFVVLSALELVVVDIIVRRWEGVRIPLLVLGIWGVTFMLGMLFGQLTRPHAVGSDGIRVRSGTEVDIPLRWDDIESVSIRKHTETDKQPKVTVDAGGAATLHLRMQNETNLAIELTRPLAVRLPHGSATVSRINLYADDPKGFLAQSVRSGLTTG